MKYQLAHWKGSVNTAEQVREEIARRYGEEEAKNYDPQVNCFTLPTWNKLGFKVRKGEKSIRSMTFIEKEDKDTKEGEQIEKRTYPKTVSLFYIKQVEKRQ
jgi:antirestriction protein ArdC